MNATANKTVVTSFIDAINRKAWSELDALVASDVRRHSQVAGAPSVTSLDELKAFLRGEADTFPDAHERVHFLIAEDDKVAALLEFTGTQRGALGPFPPCGGHLRADFMCIFRIEGSRIAEVWAAWDNLDALVQLGHYSPPSP